MLVNCKKENSCEELKSRDLGKPSLIFSIPGFAHIRRFSRPFRNGIHGSPYLIAEKGGQGRERCNVELSSFSREDSAARELNSKVRGSNEALPTDRNAHTEAKRDQLTKHSCCRPGLNGMVPDCQSSHTGEGDVDSCDKISMDLDDESTEEFGGFQSSYLDCIEIEESAPLDIACDEAEEEERQLLLPYHSSQACQRRESLDTRQLAAASSAASSNGVLVSNEDIWEPGTRAADELETWLQSINCVAEKAAFLKAGLSLQDIPCLSEEDLLRMGLSKIGCRKRILAAASLLKPGCQSSSPPAKRQALAPSSGQQGAGTITDFFLSKPAFTTKSCITDFFATAEGGRPPKPPKSATQGPGGKENSMKQLKYVQRGKSGIPEWHRVPGTSFVVDHFGRKVEEASNCRSWFLTHFHADHYMGLNGRFRSGLVYCTKITAKLANARLNVSMDRIKVVQLNEPIVVEGVRVTFVDANHCPGSAMILFQVPGKRPALHTGDCRYHSGMQAEEVLSSQRGSLELYLDTTYCSPQYTFPLQHEVLEYVINVFKAEKYNQNKTLFLFGSYTVGKERLFLEAAKRLQQKIYVSRAKRKVLEALELPREYRMLLTENDLQATIQAVRLSCPDCRADPENFKEVPMGFVNLKRMANIAKHYRSRFTTIVGIQPTGWTHSATRGRTGRGRKQKGSLILYSVPYSEHSSFTELREFVRWLQPARIVPTVGNDRGPKTSSMLSMLRP